MSTGHELPSDHRVVATPILGGLHHEYCLEAATWAALKDFAEDRCGKELLVRLDEIRDERVIDCDRCKQSRGGSHRLADGSSLTG